MSKFSDKPDQYIRAFAGAEKDLRDLSLKAVLENLGSIYGHDRTDWDDDFVEGYLDGICHVLEKK